LTTPPRHLPQNRAFTLIELLAVIAIISLLIGIASLAFQNSLQSQNLRATARQLAADLDHASLLARKENRPVDVFFYQYAPGELGGTSSIRAYQFGILDGFNAEDKPQYRFLVEVKRLPSGMIITTNPTYTTMAGLTPQNPLTQPGSGVPESHTFFAYQIRPDGSTTLDRDSHHTLTLLWEKDESPDHLPPDFRTISINPHTSRAVLY
jgi:uncharacterized protein (TIGR02596 family)